KLAASLPPGPPDAARLPAQREGIRKAKGEGNAHHARGVPGPVVKKTKRKQPKTAFKKGCAPGPGRPKGSLNKFSGELVGLEELAGTEVERRHHSKRITTSCLTSMVPSLLTGMRRPMSAAAAGGVSPYRRTYAKRLPKVVTQPAE